ncbi:MULTISPECIES: copper resistance CopC family protein [unclassified Microbacterium]|uniref:copper resistance CopC family protein n=1 Tax=unclassified Microbacterium TaxID=2609290 RepID=UPI00214C0749|nr:MULTISPECIES: copper resistance CopC family protein [unclassified Microbacterium]MCR2809128.1 copper resistance protein CopC [Microbacterium sp. zg.B185]WIM20281.1 copper resistance protein CopC [Microbacterium sp. zg-B185]
MRPTTTSPRSLVRSLAATATALLLATAGVLVASPAHAHDELISTDPPAGAALETLPPQLTLTFSGELASDPGATELQVTDAAGTTLADGDPVVEGTLVTQPLTGTASGPVTVLWKVVSSDGHPISGEFAFSVTPAPAPSPTPTSSPSATGTPSETPSQEATATPTAAPVPADSGNPALPWVIGGLLLVALVGGAVVYLLVSRARRLRDQEALRAGPPATPGDAPSPDSAPPAGR